MLVGELNSFIMATPHLHNGNRGIPVPYLTPITVYLPPYIPLGYNNIIWPEKNPPDYDDTMQKISHYDELS